MEKMFSDLKIADRMSFRENLNRYEEIHLGVQWCMMDALDENRWNVLLVGINYDKKIKEKDKRASVHDREV